MSAMTATMSGEQQQPGQAPPSTPFGSFDYLQAWVRPDFAASLTKRLHDLRTVDYTVHGELIHSQGRDDLTHSDCRSGGIHAVHNGIAQESSTGGAAATGDKAPTISHEHSELLKGSPHQVQVARPSRLQCAALAQGVHYLPTARINFNGRPNVLPTAITVAGLPQAVPTVDGGTISEQPVSSYRVDPQQDKPVESQFPNVANEPSTTPILFFYPFPKHFPWEKKLKAATGDGASKPVDARKAPEFVNELEELHHFGCTHKAEPPEHAHGEVRRRVQPQLRPSGG